MVCAGACGRWLRRRNQDKRLRGCWRLGAIGPHGVGRVSIGDGEGIADIAHQQKNKGQRILLEAAAMEETAKAIPRGGPAGKGNRGGRAGPLVRSSLTVFARPLYNATRSSPRPTIARNWLANVCLRRRRRRSVR